MLYDSVGDSMKVVISARNFIFDGCDAVALLERHGFETVDVSDKTMADEAAYFEAIKDADAVINAFEPMSKELLAKCKKLQLISVRGVGYDYIDAAACRELGIVVMRTVGTVGEAVSELAMGYLLHFAREIPRQNAAMQQGKWERVMTEGLHGKTLGVLGFGEIGQALAKKAAAFGMRVLYHCRTPKAFTAYTYVPLDTLLAQSDYLVLALPLNDETRGMIDAAALAEMKPDAVLVNVARAGIADADALRDAVTSGRLRGAAVDVYETEPCTDSPLRGVENILLTPHTAPFTKKNFIDMNFLSAENVVRFFDGTIDKKYLV